MTCKDNAVPPISTKVADYLSMKLKWEIKHWWNPAVFGVQGPESSQYISAILESFFLIKFIIGKEKMSRKLNLNCEPGKILSGRYWFVGEHPIQTLQKKEAHITCLRGFLISSLWKRSSTVNKAAVKYHSKIQCELVSFYWISYHAETFPWADLHICNT